MSGTGHTHKNVGPTGTQLIDGLISGNAWGDTSLTFSFPTSRGEFNYMHWSDSFAPISLMQQNAARWTLDQGFGNAANDGFSVEGFTNLTINHTGAANAHIRLAESDNANPTAYAYYPGTWSGAGDVWFGQSYNYRSPEPGTYFWHTLMHEIGHALGLKHGHETDVFGALPGQYDSMEYSIMTYRSYEGQSLSGGYSNETYGYAQSFMMADIAALQHMYGADFNTNSGNSVYKWNPGSGDTLVNGAIAINAGGNRIFATIWDGGGIDTYDLSAYNTDLRIDLTPGGHSTFSAVQTAHLGDGNYASGNIYNALQFQGDSRSLIENAIGGSGDDSLTGNDATNMLVGGLGNDELIGANGNDTLIGGRGRDVLDGGNGNDVLNGGKGSDRLIGGNGNDRLVGDNGNDTLIGTAGNNTMYGGQGRDTLIDGTGGSTLYGNGGKDRLIGGGGNDHLLGGAGNDTLAGGNGNDILAGQTGRDYLVGGNGADTFVFHTNMGNDRVNDFVLGDDRLFFESTLTGGNMDEASVLAGYATITADGVVFDFGGGNVVTLLGLTSIAGLEAHMLIT